MKTNKVIALLAFVSFPAMLLAQATNTITSTTPLPESTKDFWKYGIAVVVPIIVNLFKKIAPNIPSWLIPVSTPLLGVGLGAILKALGQSHMGWVDMAEAGALAVMIRESWNQILTKPMQASASKVVAIGFATMLTFNANAAKESLTEANEVSRRNKANATAARIAKEYKEQFKAGEYQLEIAGQARTVDMRNFDKSLTVGGNYYVTAGGGLHAALGFRDNNYTLVDRVEWSLIGRIPIPTLSVALLFGVGAEWQQISETVKDARQCEKCDSVSRSSELHSDFSIFAEAGPLFRVNKNLDLFAKVRGVRPIDGAEREHIALIAGTAITF